MRPRVALLERSRALLDEDDTERHKVFAKLDIASRNELAEIELGD
jgi:hypothetical protein